MTACSLLAPEVALNNGLLRSKKRKRMAEPVEDSKEKPRYDTIRNATSSTTTHHGSGFWDILKTIYLTHSALEEFDRRDALTSWPEPPKINHRKRKRQQDLCVKQLRPFNSPHLKQFSRTGGPDLTDIRGV